MSAFADSFGLIIGTTNKTIDLFDNPYIQINVYDIDETWKPKISNIKLHQCNSDEMKFIGAGVAYYPNSLCFEDVNKIPLKGNWFNKEYKNIYLSIDACNQVKYKA